MTPAHASRQSNLSQHADHWFRLSRAALLEEIPCRQGCSRCCIGPFTITTVDATALREGMAHLDALTRQDIESRARIQVASMEREFPALTPSPFLDDWPNIEVDQLAGHFAGQPCPVCTRIAR